MIKSHKYADLFPMMNDEEFKSLVDDMKKNGYDEHSPIVTYKGEILDGRNRYKAAQLAGVKPDFTEYVEDDPLGFVLRHNLKRRHLNESQRAVIAGRLANMDRADTLKQNRSANLQNGDDKVSQAEAAAMLNVSPRTVAAVKAVEKAAPELIEKIERGELTASKAEKQVKAEANKNKPQPETPDGKYRVIYADPPWKYTSGDQHSRDEQDTVLGNHYASMSIEELCKLPVKNMTQENAVLFLWVTSPLLEECFDVIRSWGFEYKTSIVWDKDAHNVGHYVSVRHEFLLICTKGSCKPDIDKLLPSVVREKRTQHSVKPEIFRSMIDEMYPKGKRIELFARKNVSNWDAWGNDV